MLKYVIDVKAYLEVVKKQGESQSWKTATLTAMLCKESDPRIRERFRPYTNGESFQFKDLMSPQDWEEVASALKPNVWRPEEWGFHSFGDAADQKAHELEPIEKDLFMFFNNFKMTLYQWGQRAGGQGQREPKVLPKFGNQMQVPVRYVYATILKRGVEEALGSDGRLNRGIHAGISFVRWQITHPANFPKAAQKLMRLAAGDAGINESSTGESFMSRERVLTMISMRTSEYVSY